MERDTSMELGSNRQIDTLKNIGCEYTLETISHAIYRPRYKVPDPARYFHNFNFGLRYHDNDATTITRDAGRPRGKIFIRTFSFCLLFCSILSFQGEQIYQLK